MNTLQLNCYLQNESVGQVEKSNHSTPINTIRKDAPGHLHEDFLSTVALNLVDQTKQQKQMLKMSNV